MIKYKKLEGISYDIEMLNNENSIQNKKYVKVKREIAQIVIKNKVRTIII
jgi:hypothetical protein